MRAELLIAAAFAVALAFGVGFLTGYNYRDQRKERHH